MRTTCLPFLLFLLFHSVCKSQTAQFATAGTGTMRNYISWFDWANTPIINGATKTFSTADGLVVTVTLSNVSGPVLTPYIMNTWNGAVLWKLYDFVDPAVKPALYSINTPSPLTFTMNFAATRAGVPTPFTLVAADAEASDVSEVITMETSGTAWRSIEFFRNSSQTANPAVGCGTSIVNLSQTYGRAPQSGQNPILATDANGTITIRTLFSIGGGTGVAFGIFSPIDRGDLPPSFLTAQHKLHFTTNNSCNYSAPFPSIVQDNSLKLGSIAGDADGAQINNDNINGADEDAITTFPMYDGSGSYSLNLSLTNTTGTTAFLTGWFDYNRDGTFVNSEAVSITLPNGASAATLTWSGLPVDLSNGTWPDFSFRFRLASNRAEVLTHDGYANDGEVEDYFVSKTTIIGSIQARFAATDTVCMGIPVTIINNTAGASTYYWSFFETTCNKAASPNSVLRNPLPAVYSTPGTYFIHLVVDNGLPTQSSTCQQIVVLPKPVHFPIKDIAVCEGDSIKIGSSSLLADYTWNTDLSKDSILVKAPGIYWVEANQKGCTNRDSFSLVTKPKPVINLEREQEVCQGSSTQITTRPLDIYTYNWFPSGSLSNTTASSPSASPLVTTTYIVNATTSTGCVLKDSIKVIVNAKPVITVTNDTTICINSPVQLNATGGRSYTWSPVQNLSSASMPNPVATPQTTTKYFVTATADNNCNATDSILITLKDPAVFEKPGDRVICEGDTTQLLSDNKYQHVWSPSDHLNSSTVFNPLASPAVTMNYTVKITDPVCKNDSAFLVKVSVNAKPTLSLQKTNDIDCTNPSSQLMALGAVEYVWSPSTGLNDHTIPDPLTSTTSTITYNVTGKNALGCSNTDSITVEAKNVGELSLFVPTAFSPNRDGRNDCFGIKRWQGEELELSIFNRWGELVFATKNASQCWNGNFDGKPQPSDVYVYIIKGMTRCGAIFKKGTFTLIR